MKALKDTLYYFIENAMGLTKKWWYEKLYYFIIIVAFINYYRENQNNYSITKKMLKKYKRQYVGYLTNDNDIVVWINFIRNKDVCNDE